MVTRGESSEFAIDEGDELADQIVRIVADRRRIDVLIPAECGETIGKDHHGRTHLAVMDQARDTLRDVVGKGPPVRMRQARAVKTDQVPKHGKSFPQSAPFCLVVLWREPNA